MSPFSKQKEDNPDAEFGLGSSAFQQGDVETALRAFEQALNTDDPGLKSKAFYNLGNSLYQQKNMRKAWLAIRKHCNTIRPTGMPNTIMNC